MNDVTLCLAYYLNRTMLQLQFEKIRSYSKEIHEHLQVIVVDDGSPQDPATPEDIGCKLKIYRMGVDVRWNQDACRNLAVAEAETKWVLLTDMDHLVPEATMRDVITRKLSWKGIYRFSRVSAPDLAPYKPHPNSWLMTREMYDRIGGYDERFAGWYGTDSDFRDRAAALAKIDILKSVLVRVPREVIPDASTTTYARKTVEDNANLARIKAERRAEKDQRPKRNLFPWSRVC